MVGRSIGANNPEMAKAYANIVFTATIGFSIVLGVFFFIFRNQIPTIFT